MFLSIGTARNLIIFSRPNTYVYYGKGQYFLIENSTALQIFIFFWKKQQQKKTQKKNPKKQQQKKKKKKLSAAVVIGPLRDNFIPR